MDESLKVIIERLDKILENQQLILKQLESIEDWQDTNAQIDEELKKSMENEFAMMAAEHKILMGDALNLNKTVKVKRFSARNK